MRIADHPKKLCLLLLPVVPLTAFGIVEVVNGMRADEAVCTLRAKPEPMPKPNFSVQPPKRSTEHMAHSTPPA